MLARSKLPRAAITEFPSEKEQIMNWDTVKGDWKQFKGKVKEAWGKLTDDELDVIAGKRDQLIGAIQKSYAVGRDEAERQVAQFERSSAAHSAPVDSRLR
jgi:uncharacterized protein YjbJ (UPF0337 family)